MPVTGGAALLVEGFGVLVALGGGNGPPAAGVGQASVTGPAHQHHPAASGGAGDGCGSRVGAAAGGIAEAGRVVTELAQHAGAEDQAESGQTAHDLGVRVLLKTRVQRGLELADSVECGGQGAHQASVAAAIAASTTGGCRSTGPAVNATRIRAGSVRGTPRRTR